MLAKFANMVFDHVVSEERSRMTETKLLNSCL